MTVIRKQSFSNFPYFLFITSFNLSMDLTKGTLQTLNTLRRKRFVVTGKCSEGNIDELSR
jgi:hypothetical protein